MKYNEAGQEFHVLAFDVNGRVSGDAANITCALSIDGAAAAATDDVNPTEIGTTGEYIFSLVQAESLGHQLSFRPVSATSGVQVLGVPSNVIYTSLDDAINEKITNEGVNIISRVDGTTLIIFIGEQHPFTLQTDDYTTKTLALAFETKAGVDVAVIADGSLTKTSTSVTFTVPSAVSSVQRTLLWSLRDTANGDEVLLFGLARITNTALDG